MVKCPKCSFEQPEDIYCANCGVNMKTYRPTGGSFFKEFIGSWMGKIFIITLLIIGALVYDMQKDKDRSSTMAQEAPAHSANVARRDSAPPPAPAPPTPAQRATQFAAGNVEKTAASQPITPNPVTANEKPAAAPVAAAVGPAVLRVSFYSANRAAIQDLQREAMAAPSSGGDAMGGIVPENKINTVTQEMKSLASSRYKVLDNQKPIIIYKGQRTAEVKAGIYFQITPLRHEGRSLQFELKSWGNLKPQDNDETFFTSEMTINPQQAAFIAGFLPHDKTFTDEEKAVLEADPTLKIYNQEDFTSGASDLIMVVEMTTAP